MPKIFPAASLFLALSLMCAGSAGAVSQEQATVDAIQKKYEATRTLKAKFVQKAFIKLMDQAQTTEGEVFIKKPGKMKWLYNAPDPQVLISDGNTLWLYVPEENQVNKMPMENVYSNNTPALFLAGKGKLTESFEVARVASDSETYQVELIPKDKKMNVKMLTLFADKKSYQILGSSVYDKLGNKTEIKFTQIEINPDLADGIFQFQKPQGVELLDFTDSPKTNK